MMKTWMMMILVINNHLSRRTGNILKLEHISFLWGNKTNSTGPKTPVAAVF